MNKPTLVVLAAGIGSRYGGLKQIEPIGPSGEIVIDYSIYDAIAAGFGKIVFVIRRDIEEAFRAKADPHFARRIPVDYAFQELSDLPAGFQPPAARPKPWGTAHAVYAARKAVKEPFGVINADDFYGRSSFQLLADQLKKYDAKDNRYCLVAFVLRNTLSDFGPVARGVCRATADGHLAEVVERKRIEPDGHAAKFLDGEEWKPLTGDEPVSMNLWGFTPTFFDYLEEDFRAFLAVSREDPKAEHQLPTVVDKLVHQRRVTVDILQSHEKWLGVTYPDDKALVQKGVRDLIKAGVYPEKLW